MSDIPNFTGVPANDLDVLAECLLDEIERKDDTCASDFDVFSLGVNDGTRMFVNLACGAKAPHVRFGEFRLDDLMAGWEAIEQQYDAVAGAGPEAVTPAAVSKLDEKLLSLYRSAGSGDGEPSLDTGIHIPFQGKPEVPQWSLFVRNETVRTLVCSQEGADVAYELFSHASARTMPPNIIYMPRVDPLLPMGVLAPRAMQQIEAQSLEADVVMFAREGMLLWRKTAAELWKTYCLIRDRIVTEAENRRGRLTWIFHGAEQLLPERLFEIACRLLSERFGDDRCVTAWEASRQGYVRRAISLPDVVRALAQGFPDYRTAAAGGVFPMVVDLQPGDSARQIPRRIEDAWERYIRRFTKEFPLRAGGEVHRPAVIVLTLLGVVTVGRDAELARLAYDAFTETLLLMESAQGLGGVRPLSEREAVGVARGRFAAAV
ncbi:MAG: hypothetical protein GXP31_02725 [Kiritimatiellaeota bacterium]|nr:hypothetical protein [Kiritimatiellota bacterium]